MPNVNIEGYDTPFWFPDSWSDEEIEREVKRRLALRDQRKIDYGGTGLMNFLASTAGNFSDQIGKSLAGLGKMASPIIGDSFTDYINEMREVDRKWTPTEGRAAQAGQLVGSIAGSIAPAVLTGGAGAALRAGSVGARLLSGAVGGGTFGAGYGLEEQRERMREAEMAGAEIDPGARATAYLGGAGLGALEAVPGERYVAKAVRPLQRLLSRKETLTGVEAAKKYIDENTWRKILGDSATQAGVEGVQEGFGQGGQNFLERELYNPEREVMEGVLPSVGVGAGVGGALEFLTGAYGRGRARGRINRVPPPPGGPPEYPGLSDMSDDALRGLLSIERERDKRSVLEAEARRRGMPETGDIPQEPTPGPFEEHFAYSDLFDEAAHKERRAGGPPEVPETGVPEGVSRAQDARERLAMELLGRPWGELLNSERISIDELVTEGYMGGGAESEPGRPPVADRAARLRAMRQQQEPPPIDEPPEPGPMAPDEPPGPPDLPPIPSHEDELNQILRDALSPDEPLGDLINEPDPTTRMEEQLREIERLKAEQEALREINRLSEEQNELLNEGGEEPLPRMPWDPESDEYDPFRSDEEQEDPSYNEEPEEDDFDDVPYRGEFDEDRPFDESGEPTGLRAYMEQQRERSIANAALKILRVIREVTPPPSKSELMSEFGLTEDDYQSAMSRVKNILKAEAPPPPEVPFDRIANAPPPAAPEEEWTITPERPPLTPPPPGTPSPLIPRDVLKPPEPKAPSFNEPVEPEPPPPAPPPESTIAPEPQPRVPPSEPIPAPPAPEANWRNTRADELAEMGLLSDREIEGLRVPEEAAPPPESVAPEPQPVAPEPQPAVEEPQAAPAVPLGQGLHSEFFRPGLGITEEEVAQFLDRVVNRGVPVKQALLETFKNRSIEATTALRRMDVIDYDPETRSQELTFNPENRPPAARVLPEPVAAPTAEVPRETPAATNREVAAQAKARAKDFYPENNLYTKREFVDILDILRTNEYSTLMGALVNWSSTADNLRSTKTDQELIDIYDHIIKNRPELFTKVEMEMGPDGNPFPDYILNKRAGGSEDFLVRARAALEPELQKIAGAQQGPILDLAQQVLDAAGDPVEGSFNREKNIVRISMDATNPKLTEKQRLDAMMRVLREEAFHAVWTRFTPEEQALLLKEANKAGLLAEAEQAYAGRPGYTPEMIGEESAARLFTNHLESGKPLRTKAAQKLYDRVINLVKSIGNSMRGMGFQTADDVLERLRKGEIGEREGGAGEGPEMLSVPREKKPDEDRFLTAAKAARAKQPLDRTFTDQELQHIARLAMSGIDLDAALQVDPNKHFNIEKLNLSRKVAEQFGDNVALEVIDQKLHPKDRVTQDEVRAMAEPYVGLKGVDLKRLNLTGNEDVLRPEIRLAAAETVKGLRNEMYGQQVKYAKESQNLSPEGRSLWQSQIDQLGKDMQALLDILMPARTEDGRNLAFHKIMARDNFDPTYWTAQLKRQMSLPPNVDLPAEVFADLNMKLGAGAAAKAELQDAQKAEAADPSLANQEKVHRARKKTLEAQKDLGELVSKARKTSWGQFAVHLWKAGLLTGFKTPLVNQFSTASFNALEKLNSIPASWIDMIMKLKTGRRALLSQVGPSTGEMLKAEGRGQKEGWEKFLPTIGKGFQSQSTVDTQTLGVVDIPKMVTPPNESWLAKKLANYINGVYSIQQAGDLPWATGSRQRFLVEHSRLQAMEEFRGKNLSPDKINTRAAELAREATAELDSGKVKEGSIASRVLRDSALETFNNETPASKVYDSAKRQLYADPSGRAGGMALDVLMPFMKVPTNIMARVLEYSPIGFGKATVHIFRAALAEKMTADQQRMIAQLLSRAGIGTAFGYLGFLMAQWGWISGIRGKSDVSGKAADEAVGRPPGAVRIGDRWYQYNRLAPVGNLISAGASIWQEMNRPLRSERDQNDPGISMRRIENAAGILGQTVSELPMVQGIVNAAGVINEPGAFGPQFAEKLIGSTVPTMLSDIGIAIDPKQRDLRAAGPAGAFLSRLPGIRQATIPERYDVLGRTMERPGAPGGAVAGGIGSLIDFTRSQRARTDPVSEEIERSQRGIGRITQGDDESDESYRLRAALAGRIEANNLARLYRSGRYQSAGENEKLDLADKAHNKSRTQAADLLKRKSAYRQAVKHGDHERQEAILYQTLQRYRELVE